MRLWQAIIAWGVLAAAVVTAIDSNRVCGWIMRAWLRWRGTVAPVIRAALGSSMAAVIIATDQYRGRDS
jgi:hypothetical protein